MANNAGKVWLVGAGPSDPGLFTLKGKSVLEQADVVVYDKLVGQGILSMIPEETEKIYVGKVSGNHAVPQHEINQILLREAQKGKRVVRLKGGDPFVFGRGGEELELLVQNRIGFEIVPGITSAVSVPAYNGIPVTHRDFVSSLHIITGHTKKSDEAEIDYEALVKLEGTYIFLMGVAAIPKICAGLINAGIDPNMPAAILERGTTAHQRRIVSDVSHLPEDAEKARVKTPAIIVVGKVCSLAEDFHWAEDRPLGGLKVAVTRPRDRSSELAQKLAFLGAEIVLIPTIETKTIENNEALESAFDHIENYDWAVFTSPVGVDIFFNKLRSMNKDIRCLMGLQFAAIGSATKKNIEERGILVDLMPDEYSGKELGELLSEIVLKQEKDLGRKVEILIPRAKIGTEDVLKPLIQAGLSYEDLPIYDTIEQVASENAIDTDLDYIAFTSASTVKGFVKQAGLPDYTHIKAVCIGKKTAEEAQTVGMQITVAKEATIDSMIETFKELAR